jgi:hypothetical protein
LPSQSDPGTESQATTPAELNPLVNPLLAENMGRWAETYFTAAPEHREQAVLDLLRQLEVEKANGTSVGTDRQRAPHAATTRLLDNDPLLRCEVCGHENPASHRFCGMCGLAIHPDKPSLREREGSRIGEEFPPTSFDAPTEGWDGEDNSYQPAPRNENELSLFQNVAGGHSDYEDAGWIYDPPSSSPYRAVIGVVLAVLILGLGYMAWRGMQNSRESARTPAPPPVTTEAPAPTPPAAQTSASNEPPPSPAPADPGPPKASETAAGTPPAAKEPEPVAPRNGPSPKPTATAGPESPAASQPQAGNGGEELALAQHFLAGANGQGRDPAEAAKLLWKSIEKHNTHATVPLADLYLKGEGVSKNCDQARVLLDSAARKGVAGAGQRLRNLQAFGCQ